MPVRKAEAAWEGDLKGGKGSMKLASGAYEGQYSFNSRFENGTGTNPEELIAAAHAGCFSMAFPTDYRKQASRRSAYTPWHPCISKSCPTGSASPKSSS